MHLEGTQHSTATMNVTARAAKKNQKKINNKRQHKRYIYEL